MDDEDVADYAAGATAKVVVDVTNERGQFVTGLLAEAFEFRVDGELRSATYDSGSYTFSLPFTLPPPRPGLLQYVSVDTDPGVTTYDLTVEVVRPHPSTGKPLAGLGRARFTIH